MRKFLCVRLAKLPEGQGQTGHWAANQLQGALQAGWYDWDELPPPARPSTSPSPASLP